MVSSEAISASWEMVVTPRSSEKERLTARAWVLLKGT
jgi:hypothetical protein